MPSPENIVRARIKDVGRLRAELQRIDYKTDLATLAGLRAAQRLTKRNIRSRMRGRPRWDRRGASSRTGEEVDLALSPHVVKKRGGPGRLTGSLNRAVGGMRKPKPVPGGFLGGVGVGGVRVTYMYRHIVERDYPFFEPGVKKSEREIPGVYEKAWRGVFPK